MSTDAERETIYRLRKLHNLDWKIIYPLFPHIPKASQRRVAAEYKEQNDTHTNNKITIEETADGQNLVVRSISDRIKTLDDLIKVAKIDLDKWQIDRWTANVWEQGQKGNDNTVVLVQLFQVKAILKPHPLQYAKLNLDDHRQEIKQAAPTYHITPYTQTKSNNDKLLLEISIPDLHFGKLAWQPEAGDTYSMDIAEQLYRNAATALLNAAYSENIEKILLPTGNDLFHIDLPAGTTTKGTRQDVDGKLRQHFRRVRLMVREIIQQLLTAAPVDVLIIPGNHDRYLSYYLGEALEDWFYKTPEVTIYNQPTTRKYYQYGTNLIGFTHGDQERPDRLPMIMANEVNDQWAQSTCREWHLGHRHRKNAIKFQPLQTVDGVIIREIPSLSATDEWHYLNGFIGNIKAAEAFLWHPTNGMIAQHYANLSSKNIKEP